MAGLMALSSALLCAPYFVTLITNPIASNNIYEQQYQMHRFATEYYNKPLAVNDLGYVSYQNNNYVLDLWGLASMEALKMNDGNAKWIANIIQKNNIKFAMIYDNWFKNRPNYWQKLGELRIGRMKVTPAEASVSFYAMDCESYTEIYPLIEAFSTTLPEGVVFEIAPNNCINTDKLKHGS